MIIKAKIELEFEVRNEADVQRIEERGVAGLGLSIYADLIGDSGEVASVRDCAHYDLVVIPDAEEIEYLTELAEKNGWDLYGLQQLFGYQSDELQTGEKSVFGIIEKAIEDGDAPDWIEEMLTKEEEPHFDIGGSD